MVSAKSKSPQIVWNTGLWSGGNPSGVNRFRLVCAPGTLLEVLTFRISGYCSTAFL